MEADIRIHIFLHYVVGYGKAAGPGTTKHKKIMSEAGRLMPLLHLYDDFFTLTNLFCKEQRQDALAPILLVGMAAFRYLAHVIFHREQSLL